MHYVDSYNVVDQTTENPVTIKFYNAMKAPLQQRCGELTVLFDKAHPKDLQNLFPVLIENIFGSTGTSGWGLRSITNESNQRDFSILHHFLAPLGPVFRLIYKLLGEYYVRYEYPLSQLPMKIRNNLENGHISPFYSDIVYQDSQSRQLICLQLNPFDYYMFQFAWHLISPYHQRNSPGNQWGLWKTVYYILSCDYLIHFLPTDPSNPIPLPYVSPQFTGKNPLVSHHPVQNKNIRASKLFRSQILQQASMEINVLHQTYQQHPRNEIWRSETLIQVFIDIWLTNDQLFSNQQDISFYKQAQLQMYELPSGEYIRIIRVGVKQLHAFVDSGKYDISPIGELKKLVLPMIQGKMYIFLRHLIHRWPLDGSFRLLLELWLSFIQPWRYPANYHARDRNVKNENEDISTPNKEIDRKYLRFIADNLLAYTVIFQQLLPRFLRIDLTSPKNAVLMYRVTKVFAQPNLVAMIKEVESCVDNRNHSPSHSYSGMWSSLPPLSPTSNWSTNTANATTFDAGILNRDSYAANVSQLNMSPAKMETTFINASTPIRNGEWTAIVRQHIFELEGPEFFYKPMFTDKPAREVIQLLNHLRQAIISAKQILEVKEESRKQQQTTIIGYIKSMFTISNEIKDEFSIDERRKVPDYLMLAQEYLMTIFDLHSLDESSTSLDDSFQQANYFDESTSSSNIDQSPLTPEMVKKRMATLRYEGDPDLMPPTSTESAVLVNVCNSIAKRINEMYGEYISGMYYRNDFYGALAQQLIQPPRLIKTYHKSFHGGVSPRVQRMLPPRISLRNFASHKFIYSFVICMIIGRMFGYGVFSTILIIFLIVSFVIFVKALYQYETRNYRRNQNISYASDISS